MLVDDVQGGSTPAADPVVGEGPGGRRWRMVLWWCAGAAAVVALVGGELMAAHIGALGPLTSLARDFAGSPKSATTSWAGFGLALVGLRTRERIVAGAAAVGIDLVFVAARAVGGHKFTVGNGPTLVLTALAVVVVLRWAGERRRTALRTIGIGALLILATKVSEIWLDITAWACPTVLDAYVQAADHALGNPSWLVGQWLAAAGPVALGVVRWVYFELPVAAMVVACWQLRGVAAGVWPRHHLVRTFLTLGLVGPIWYVVFPVVGPVLAYGPEGHGFQIADVWPNIVPAAPTAVGPLAFDAITPRNCMPSLHTAWALSLFIHSRRGPWWLRWGGAFWLVCTLVATLGLGAHYGIDLVVGAALGLTVESALRDPDRGWDRARVRVVAMGAVLFAGTLLCIRFLAVPMATHPLLFGLVIMGSLAALGYTFYLTWFAPSAVDRHEPTAHLVDR
ncbi:phosphatase PAP2 family protein [Nocardia sp. CDC159]|uniref:Phosphatase PAP2 family protein n=1 Tax=Nocardia pulmonis TaxID=2951408 RepID=A0A9X2IU52_9NOCA|nr:MULTISPECIES: phosphatase PAP2 family protein [Nocardia]MCM6772507.1 phosphatase PAP2 family protein [Nocardia pulmonis]MCM6784835.1 phosphatase PAP2 family protein [Nocardia sp. CDC159]